MNAKGQASANGGFGLPKLLATAFRRPDDLPAAPTDLGLLRGVQAWLCGDAPDVVARYIGVTPGELPEITQRKGWRFIEDCVRDDVRQIAMSNLTRLTHRCFRLLDERLDKGDPIYSPDGEVVGYRAVKAKDLSNIASQMIDKHLEIEKRLNKHTEEEQLELKDLAKSLENYAKEKRFREARNVIDASPT